MQINKQLFEDVLSGRLKGTFVLRNGKEISSIAVKRQGGWYELCGYGFSYICYDNGRNSCFLETQSDIIDFIPDTNMKENELTIEIPDNKVVGWDESKKQNKIVLKDKQLTYKDICKKLFGNKEFFFTNNTGIIESSSPAHNEYLVNAINNSTSYHQLECILAKNMLTNTAKYLNNGWKPGKTSAGHFDAWVIYITPDKNYIGCVKITRCSENSNALFKSAELAKQAIEILGEETIKLALEPLGI